MRAINYGLVALQARLMLRHTNVGIVLAGLLLGMAAFVWLWIVPQTRNEQVLQQKALAQVQLLQHATAPAAAVQSPAQQRLAAFYDTVGEKKHVEQQLVTVFMLAGRAGLQLDQGEYKLRYDPGSRIFRYEIVLPITGSYQAIRTFAERTLLAIPFAALDELSFTRDTIAGESVEAKLRFTLYLRDVPGRSQGMSNGQP